MELCGKRVEIWLSRNFSITHHAYTLSTRVQVEISKKKKKLKEYRLSKHKTKIIYHILNKDEELIFYDTDCIWSGLPQVSEIKEMSGKIFFVGKCQGI